jgi:predicted aspartyl protease
MARMLVSLVVLTVAVAGFNFVIAAADADVVYEGPLTSLRGGGGPVVNCTINGDERLLFLDTGYGSLSLAPEFSRIMGNSIGEQLERSLQGDNKKLVYEAPDIRVGGISLAKSKVVVDNDIPRASAIDGVEYHGFVGTPLLEKRVLQLDFDSRRLRILDVSRRMGNQSFVGVVMLFSVPTIRIRVGSGQFEDAVLDTGNSAMLLLPKRLLEKVPLNTDRIEIHQTESDRKTFSNRQFLLREVEFGGHTFRDVVCMEARFPSIGMPLISRFNVTLDYPNKRLYLEPRKGLPERDAPDSSGLRLKRTAAGTFVRDLYLDSAGYKAGLRADDRIVSLDGKPVDKESFDVMYDRLTRGGERVEFVVDRKVTGNGKPEAVARKTIAFTLRWPIAWPPVWPEKPAVKKPIPVD